MAMSRNDAQYNAIRDKALSGIGQAMLNLRAPDIMANLDKTMIKPKVGLLDESRRAAEAKLEHVVPGIFGKEADSSGEPLWMQILNVLSAPQRAVTGSFAEYTKQAQDAMQRGDNPFSVFNGFNTKVLDSAWKGATMQEKRDFDEVLSNIGWKDEEGFGAHDVVSFIGDVALDPLTYLTFGAGSALKAGSKAAATAARELAEQAGVRLSKEALKDPAGKGARELYNTVRENLISRGVDPELATKQATTVFEEMRKSATNAGKGARFKAQNNLLNFDVPFTNLTAGIGRKPGFLAKTEAKIGAAGTYAVADMLNKLGITDAGEQSRAIKDLFGVDNVHDMNIQQLDFLQKQADRYAEHAARQGSGAVAPNVFRDGADNIFAGAIPSGARRVEDLMNDLPVAGNVSSDVIAQMADMLRLGDGKPLLHGDVLVDAGRGAGRADKARNVLDGELVQNSAKTDFDFDKFVQDMGGKSRLGRAITPKHFNARSLSVTEKIPYTSGGKQKVSKDAGVVNQAAGKIRDTDNRIYGQGRQMEYEIRDLQSAAKGLSEDQLSAIPHILENRFPDNFDKSLITPQVEDVAKRIGEVLNRIGNQEMSAGVLDSMRKDYFPHVLKYDGARLQELAAKYPDDKTFQELIGRASSSQFSKERKSFQNFAQLDNYLADLQKKLGDPKISDAEKISLQEKVDAVSNMFERNPFDALTKRYYKSIKTRAMKDLYTQFEKDGLLRSAKNAGDNPNMLRDAKYKRLDKTEAKALGLEEGSLMHTDVLDALKKVEGMFTDKGVESIINKLESVQNVWKTLVTSVVPSHYWNNFVGNVFNNMLAGVGVKSYKQSARILKHIGSGKLTEYERQMFSEALENGVLHSGHTADYIKASKDLDRADKFAKVEQWARDNKFTTFMRKNAGDRVDNFTRLALFVDARKKTGSVAQAASEVRKYLFNYHEMTKADKAARLMVPFWNWMKNNIPLQIEKLAQQPRYYQAYKRLKDQTNEDAGKTPDWINESYFKVPGTDKTFVNPKLPLSDLNNPAASVVDGLTPLLKIPIEAKTNQSIFTGNPIDYDLKYKGEADPAVWADYVMKQLGGINKVSGFFDGNGNILSDIRDLIFGKPVELK